MTTSKYSERSKNTIETMGVILLTLAVFLIIGQGNLNFGLFDDNKSQWLPIIDKAYQTLFHTGHLPTIDFYQMKGMKIYDQGYYGLWNPFMLAAYVIRAYFLNFLNTNTISVYICLMIVLGNICCCKIFRECGNTRICSVLFSVSMMSVSVYTAISYWYYIYNVYFILAWLLLRLIRNREKRSYYDCGAILACSLLMGNIQYTVYMYLVYTIMTVVFFYQKKSESIMKWLSNSVCMGVLSVLPCILLLLASFRTTNFSQGNNEYYSMVVHPLIMALFSWLPSALLGSFGEKTEAWIYADHYLPDTGSFPGARSAYLGVLLCAAVIFVICRKKIQKDRFCEIAWAGVITAGITLMLSLGKIGILAIFAHQIPLLDNFRILMKWFVLIPPLLIPCFGVIAREQKRMQRKRVVFVLWALLMILGILQNRKILPYTSTVQTAEGIQRLQDLGVDYRNYRILSFAKGEEVQVTYPQWEEFDSREQVSYEEKYSKNIGTSAGIVTLGGYDLAFAYKQFQMSDHIMETMSGYATEFGYDNMVIEENFLPKYSRDNLNYWQEIGTLKEQLLDNGVKYCIFTKDSLCLPVFKQLLQDMNLTVEWQQDFLEHTTLLSIREAHPLIQDTNGNKINADVTMNKITFPVQGFQNVRISMYYDKNMQGFYIDNSGNKESVSVMPDEKGYLWISDIPQDSDGVIEITYLNRLYVSCQIWIVMEALIIGFLLFMPEVNTVKRLCQYADEKIQAVYRSLMKTAPYRGVKICFIGMICGYMGFMAFYYLHIQCTVPDEDWFLEMFRTIHKMAQGNIFSYLGNTENYLGYGQIYWILSSICPNIIVLRIISYLLIMGSMILTFCDIGNRYGRKMIPYAGILWISMPFTWFSDKIIGPEILGLFIGILGIYIVHWRQKKWIGWILLGISGAIKTYYMIFMLFAVLALLRERKMQGAALSAKGIGLSICGFLISNPILLWDTQTYLENAAMGKGFSPEFIDRVFERHEYEWDMVIVNGAFEGYISAFLLAAAVLLGLYKTVHHSDKITKYGDEAVAGILSLLLILICSRAGFLGWYLLPLCYLMEIFVCGQFYSGDQGRKAQNIKQWLLAICLLINGALLLPDHILNRQNNIEYMHMLADKVEICTEIQSEEERIKQEMPDATWYYLLDHHMDQYAYNRRDYTNFYFLNAEGIAVIGNRAQHAKGLGELVEKAVKGEEHLRVLGRTKDAWIIQRRNDL